MALYTFVPSVGPHPAGTYYLPPTRAGQNPPTAELLTEEDSDKSRITGATGGWLDMGTAATMQSGGVYTLEFFMTAVWLKTNSNANYLASSVSMFAALDAAEVDFMAYVAQGGLGTLTDRWLRSGTNTFDTKTCTARVEGRPKWQKSASGAMVTCAVTFYNPSGFWTSSDGLTLTPFH